MLTLIEEQIDGLDGSNYQNANNDDDRIINHLYRLTKNISLNSFEDINQLLNDDSLVKLIK